MFHTFAAMFNEFVVDLPSFTVFLLMNLVAMAAGIMRGFSGFGAGLLMAPIFSLMMTPKDVVVLILLLNLSATIQMLFDALRYANWPLVLRLFIPSLIGIPLGFLIISHVDPRWLRKIIGFVVFMVAAIMLKGWHYDGRRGFVQDSSTGLFGGILTAIAGIGGPPIILYLLSDRKLPVNVIRAVCIAYFGLVQIATLIPMTVMGAVTSARMSLFVAMLPVFLLANWIGSWLHRMSQGKYQEQARRFSIIVLLLTGIMTTIL